MKLPIFERKKCIYIWLILTDITKPCVVIMVSKILKKKLKKKWWVEITI